jgi:UDP-glucose 4-epimerase
MKPRKCLVTGASGFIGSHLVRGLLKEGYEVFGYDLKPASVTDSRYHHQQGDLRREKEFIRLLSSVDSVFHLAATVSVPACQEDPVGAEENNVGVTLKLLEALREIKHTQKKTIPLFFASSASNYGARGDHGRPLQEEELPDRYLSFYGAQKAASEQHCSLYSEFHGVPTLCFRFFNVYGPGQDPTSPYSGVISRFLLFLKEGQELPLHGGGKAIRDFIHVTDIAAGIVRASHCSHDLLKGQAVNLATGSSISIRELAEEIVRAWEKVSGKRMGMRTEPERPGDVRESRADISRAKNLLDFQTRVSLAAGLDELVELFYRDKGTGSPLTR